MTSPIHNFHSSGIGISDNPLYGSSSGSKLYALSLVFEPEAKQFYWPCLVSLVVPCIHTKDRAHVNQVIFFSVIIHRVIQIKGINF